MEYPWSPVEETVEERIPRLRGGGMLQGVYPRTLKNLSTGQVPHKGLEGQVPHKEIKSVFVVAMGTQGL